jgi:uncharacterized CHY-type Zn-finger protein
MFIEGALLPFVHGEPVDRPDNESKLVICGVCQRQICFSYGSSDATVSALYGLELF